MSKPWFRTWKARVGLRLAGLALIATTPAQGRLLRHLVTAAGSQRATPGELLLAALLFLCASAGAALLLIGGRLWQPVPLSGRWATHGGRHRSRTM